ncbi:MAG: HAD family hydrolase [Candidatus Lokiarchaeia archaeon]
MKFNYYLFDLDGTLLHLGNIGPYADQILRETLERLKAKYPQNRNERYKLWLSEENFFDVLQEWDVKNPQDFWKVYDKIDFEKRKILIEKNKINLYRDVKIVLEKIYNHKDNKKLAIISNAAYYIVEYVLEKFNISHYFHESFGLGYYDNDQELAKPSPKGVLKILKKFNYDPKESKAILVGDSMLDVIAAKKANIYSCLIRRDINSPKRHDKQRDIKPDFIIERLEELLNL